MSDRLGDEEEVISLGQSHVVIHNGAAGRVGHALAVLAHDPGVDLLVDDDVGELDLVLLQSSLGET